MSNFVPWQLSSEGGTGSDRTPHCTDTRGQLSHHFTSDRQPMQRRDVLLAQLARTIEAEIVPRLLMAHQAVRKPIPGEAHTPQPITDQDVLNLCEFALKADFQAASALVSSLREMDVPLDEVFLMLLAPAARRLGDLWSDDLCTFTDVTIGLSLLHRILRELSPGFGASADGQQTSYRILLVPMRGEQHTFGLLMLEEFFRRAGWDVWGQCSLNAGGVRQIVGKQWFDVVGFSVSGEVLVASLAGEIRAIRKKSRNKRLTVMVGGSLFTARPELVAEVGADGTAADAREAVMQAHEAASRCSIR